jgi:hypothetical protein
MYAVSKEVISVHPDGDVLLMGRLDNGPLDLGAGALPLAQGAYLATFDSNGHLLASGGVPQGFFSTMGPDPAGGWWIRSISRIVETVGDLSKLTYRGAGWRVDRYLTLLSSHDIRPGPELLNVLPDGHGGLYFAGTVWTSSSSSPISVTMARVDGVKIPIAPRSHDALMVHVPAD